MSEITRLTIVAKMNRIKELGEALEAELEDGKPFGLGREFAVANTNLQTALLWAIVGLNGALQGAPE
jgi:glutathione S-transferase